MAVASGTAGSVVYNAGGTTIVEHVSEWNMNISNAIQDVSAFGVTWAQNVDGLRSATGNLVAFGNPSAGNQGSIQAIVLEGNAAVSLFLYEDASKFWTVTARFTGQDTTIGVNGVLTKSWAFASDGSVIYT